MHVACGARKRDCKMNKERIFIKIKELQDKMEALDQRLSNPEEPVSALDLDTQLMYLRLMYDTYLSLRDENRPEGKRRTARGRKDQQESEVEEEQPETLETSLPLKFAEEEPELQPQRPASERKSRKAAAATAEVQPDKSDPQPETVQEQPEVPEEKPVESAPAAAETEKEPAAEPIEKEMEEPVAETKSEAEELPEVDLNLMEEEPHVHDIDLNAIEFEDEPDGDEDEEAPVSSKKASEDTYAPYYPGLNPKAMEGEPETGYPSYSGKSGQTLGEHFAHQFPSLNDQLSHKKGEDRSLGSRKQRDQINDLTKSIDLNLKFTFVRELFNGNAKLLSEELNNLNECVRLETALSLFEEMKQKYRWKEEAEAVQQLYELILRKFAR